MTLNLYLDSSDFSDLSLPSALRKPLDGDTLNFLREGIYNNSITLFYSPVHICEIIPEGSHANELSIGRASLISELCGDNLLLVPSEIMSMEISNLNNGIKMQNCASSILAPRDKFLGVCSINPSLIEHRQHILSLFEKEIAHLPRRDRRKIQSTFNFESSSGRNKWRQLFAGKIDNVKLTYPFDVLPKKLLIDWLVGDADQKHIAYHLLLIANDAKRLVSSLQHMPSVSKQLYELVRDHGEKWQNHQIDIISKLRPSLIAANDTRAPIRPFIRNIIKQSDFFSSALLSQTDGALSLTETEAFNFISQCHGFNIIINLFLENIISLIEANYSSFMSGKDKIIVGKASDFADFMHSVYIPYVDKLRCDSRTGSFLRRINLFPDRIIDKRINLLNL
ncbi:hypothetical protein [Blastochloris tepida]|uniref:hypothetical protein n=1 Tax=Blastochloris tepida TaxID=2233851 RepID=UPI000F82170D|nr:hypothetical protein [Blastochloris tepida]